MKKFVMTLSVAILFLMPADVLAQKLVCATAVWQPYVIEDGKTPGGIHVDIVRELCKRLNIEAKIQLLPWKRALRHVKMGKAQVLFSPRRTEEREKFLYYTSEPMEIERTVIMARKGSGIKVTKLDDLKGKNVGVVRGFMYDPAFNNDKDIRKTVCNDDNQLIKIFAVKSRVPLAASADEGVLRYLCKKLGVEIEVVYVLNETPSYIGVSKSLGEKGKNLAEKFSKALHQLREEGFIDKVRSKYF